MKLSLLVLIVLIVLGGAGVASADSFSHPEQASPAYTRDGQFLSDVGRVRLAHARETGSWLPYGEALLLAQQEVYPPLNEETLDPEGPAPFRRFHLGREMAMVKLPVKPAPAVVTPAPARDTPPAEEEASVEEYVVLVFLYPGWLWWLVIGGVVVALLAMTTLALLAFLRGQASATASAPVSIQVTAGQGGTIQITVPPNP